MGSGKKGNEPVKYYATLEQVICMSPADAIVEIEINGEKAFTTPITENRNFKIDKPNLFGGNNSEGGVSGWSEARFGQPTQNKSSYLGSKISSLLSATRGVVSVVSKDFYLGNNPYAKPWNFRVKSTLKNFDYSDIWYKEKATISHSSYVYSTRLNKEYWDGEKYWHITSNRTDDKLFGFRNDTSVTPKELNYNEATVLETYSASLFDVIATSNMRNQKIANNGFYPMPDSTPIRMLFPISSTEYYDDSRYINEFTANVYDSASNVFAIRLGGCPWASHNNGKWIVKNPTSATNIQYKFSTGVREITIGGHYGTQIIYLKIDGTIATESSNYRMVFTDGIVCYTGKRSNTNTFDIEGYTVPDGSSEKKNTHGHSVTVQAGDFFSTDEVWAFGCDSEYSYTYLLLKDQYGNFRINVLNSQNLLLLESISIHPTGTFVPDDCYFLLTKTFMICVCGTDIISMYRVLQGIDDYDGTQLDYNPAHAIREAITSKVWGLGKDESVIDDANFREVADVLYDEKLGISFVFESDDKVTDFIQEVLKTIGGVLRIDRATGLVQIKLLRADYDPDDLTLFDTSNVLEITDIKRTALSECINQVTCKYINYKTGEQASIVYQDLALMQAQGEIINADFDYNYVYWPETAGKLAQRDLYEASSQFFSCQIKVGLVGRFLNIGDCIKLSFPHLGIDSLVFRILKITYGGSASNEVTMELVQDKFFMPTTSGYTQPQNDETSTPSVTGIEYSKIVEMPYYVLNKFGEDVDGMLVDTSNLGGMAGVLISAYNTVRIDGAVHFYSSDETSWTNIGKTLKNDFVSSCVFTEQLDYLTGSCSFAKDSQIARLTNGYIGFIDDEIIAVDTVDLENNIVYFARGILDTVPARHFAGVTVYFIKMTDTGSYNNNELSTGTHRFKLPYTIDNSVQDLNAVETSRVVFNQRCYRPYPVACLKCYNELFPPSFKPYDMYYNSSLTWRARNRLTQLADNFVLWTDTSNVTAETGVQYEVAMLNESETIRYVYTTSDLSLSLPVPCDIEQYVKIKLRSMRNDNGTWTYSLQEVCIEGELQDIVLEFGINSYATLTLKKNSNYPISASIVDGELVIELNDSFHTTFEVDEDNNLYRVIER